MRSPITKLAIAAAIIVAVPIVLSQFGNSLENVAWADVAERFESVPFFSVTIYLSEEPSAEAHRIDIWKSEDSRVRAQEGNTVIFSDFVDGERTLVAFDRSTKQPAHLNGMAPTFLKILCPEDRFSLDTLIEQFPSGVNDLVAVETVITPASRETVVFEAQHESTPERLLIWALRESKLPVQVRFLDPRNGECGDFLFNYTDKKDSTFFDPEVFKQQATTN